MADGIEVLDPAPDGLPDLRGGRGLLDAIYQRWLERTEGDGARIASELRREIVSGEPDPGTCVALLEGHIAQIGRDHLSEEFGEGAVYRTGSQAVRAYVERVSSDSEPSSNLLDVISEIKAAFFPEELPTRPKPEPEPEPDRNGSAKLVPPAPLPIRTVSRTPRPPSGPRHSRRDRLRTANQDRRIRADIRAGLREGELSLAAVLDDPGAERMTVADVLIRVPRVGKVTLGDTLAAVGLAPETEVGALKKDEKARIVALLPAGKYRKIEPSSTPELAQSLAALERAKRVKVYRAGLKLKLTLREVSVKELFEDEIGAGMKIGEVLRSLPTHTRSRSKPPTKPASSKRLMGIVLQEAGLRGHKRCCDLTLRQRQRLFERLDARDNGTTYTASSRLS